VNIWKKLSGALGALFIVVLPIVANAQIGTAVEVIGGARLTSGGKVLQMRSGMAVNTGDEIRTDKTGKVQLIFEDATKIAIGPGSRLTVDVTLLQGGHRASKFAVNAVRGSFRFISGKSAKSAYEIQTPTATMGIRGTEFDVAVYGRRSTALATFKGKVHMCGPGGRCAFITGRCTLVRTDRRAGVAVPDEYKEAAELLRSGFPFVMSQEDLLASFRVDARGCEEHFAAVAPIQKVTPPGTEGSTRGATKAAEASPAEAAPEPSKTTESAPEPTRTAEATPEPASEPEPSVEASPEPSAPAQEPTTTSEPAPSEETVTEPEPEPGAASPGNSGGAGQSTGRGNAVSQGQNGTGTGNGRGSENGRGNGRDSGRD